MDKTSKNYTDMDEFDTFIYKKRNHMLVWINFIYLFLFQIYY